MVSSTVYLNVRSKLESKKEGKNMVFAEASNIKNKIFAPEISLNIKLLVF